MKPAENRANDDREARLRAWLAADPWRLACLEAVAALGLPDCWIGAGFLRALAWDRLHGFARPTPLADVDVIFFDPAPDAAREREIETALARRLPAAAWSARNQARMHAGNGDPPYRDSEDALVHWLETPTAVAARLTGDGAPEVLAPFGLADLFDLRVRPTPHARARPDRIAAYRRRMATKRWPAVWPGVRVDAL
ncbi:MAG: nucleotidyltransferase family protein [Kiloniellales bacterium]|nr:nucleotidyltransferase family protein [Kiloniellales bacterium]